jgi:hypothetical protein
MNKGQAILVGKLDSFLKDHNYSKVTVILLIRCHGNQL